MHELFSSLSCVTYINSFLMKTIARNLKVETCKLKNKIKDFSRPSSSWSWNQLWLSPWLPLYQVTKTFASEIACIPLLQCNMHCMASLLRSLIKRGMSVIPYYVWNKTALSYDCFTSVTSFLQRLELLSIFLKKKVISFLLVAAPSNAK